MASRSGFFLVVCAVLLVGLGITMLVSTNYYLDPLKGGGETYKNVWNQARWLGLGVALFALAALTNYQRLLAFRWWLLGLALLAMLACLFDFAGREVNGARRWLNLPGGLGGQPSEFGKIALIIALAAWYERQQDASRQFVKGILIPLLILGSITTAFWFQRDLGNMMLTGAVAVSVMFAAGVRWRYLIGIGVAGVGLGIVAILAIPNRVARMRSYFDPANNDMDLQQWVSQLAFGSGGLAGRGLGEGRMKLSYLPEAHTDFIFPMIGEEIGLIGTLGTVLLFVVIVVAGMCAAAYAPDRFGKLLGMGLVTLIALEALTNMGVTTSLLPNKGLPLPFVSYGGSALLAACIILGILLNIQRQGVYLTRDQLPVIRKKTRWTPQM